jgi:hypothetical protein
MVANGYALLKKLGILKNARQTLQAFIPKLGGRLESTCSALST